MKKKGHVTGLLCLLALVILLCGKPATTQAAQKNMPKKIITQMLAPDMEDYMSTDEYSFSYDSSGRIKKLTATSYATENVWSYTMRYKKSGKKITAVITYHGDEGTFSETYTFTSQGFLSSAPNVNSCSYKYYDKNKTKLKTLTVKKARNRNLIYTFTKKGYPDTILYQESKKYSGKVQYKIKKGLVSAATYWSFSKPTAKITQKVLDQSYILYYKYSSKTQKVSTSTAADWINRMILLTYVY